MRKTSQKLVAECDIDHNVKPSQIYHGGTKKRSQKIKTFRRKNPAELYDENAQQTARLTVLRGCRLICISVFYLLWKSRLRLKNRMRRKSRKTQFLEELIVRRELAYNLYAPQ